MKIKFDTHGNLKQKECVRAWLNPEITEIIYGGSKGSAKSYTGCSLIFGDALIYPETNYFIARKELNDLRKYTMPSVSEVFTNWGLSKNYYTYNGQDNFYTLYNGSKVFFVDGKHLPGDALFERFGSMQMTRGWIEEAGQFSKAAKDSLFATIGRWKNDVYGLVPKLLQTCNPSKNYLYADYKAHKEGKLQKHKSFIQALPTDNKKLPPGYIANLERILSGNEKKRLLKGIWEYDDDPSALIDYEAIINTFTNTFVSLGWKCITADLARFGSDKIVAVVWSGFRAEHIHTWTKSKTTDTAKRIDEIARKHSIPRSRVLVDEDGVGGGVKDILDCKGFINNSSPLNGENYANLKSQCHFKFAERMNLNEYYISSQSEQEKDAIREELEQVKQKDMDKDGKKSVVPKQDVKDLIGRSPDYSDALTMREWFELMPKLQGPPRAMTTFVRR